LKPGVVAVEGVGGLGERIAADFLRLVGYTILERNRRCGRFEIDLIVRRGECLAFVEVKTRRSDRFGTACESVRPVKLMHMRRAARSFLEGFREQYDELRFDLVAIDLDAAEGTMFVRHIRGIT
jgi:putative endonuclease